MRRELLPGLIPPDEAAAAIGVSRRTLDEHVRHGDIAYINVGRGLKRKRIMFDPADLERFKQTRRRTEPCPSIFATANTITTFGSEALDFTALLEQRRSATPNGLKTPREKLRGKR